MQYCLTSNVRSLNILASAVALLNFALGETQGQFFYYGEIKMIEMWLLVLMGWNRYSPTAIMVTESMCRAAIEQLAKENGNDKNSFCVKPDGTIWKKER